MTQNLDLLKVRATVTDADVLGRLEPAAVADYLGRNGWTQTDEGHKGTSWTRLIDRGRAAGVFLPNDPTPADFAIRMGELLATVARAEDRSQLAVLVDLYAAQSDADAGDAQETRP